MRIRLIFLYILFSTFSLYAQNSEINTTGFTFLDYDFRLPKDFLSSKSVVFVDIDPKVNSNERGDWKSFSELAHRQFRKMGIDAIGYYFIDDVKAGRDATITFAKAFKKRNVKNIVFLSNVQDQFAIVITPFNGEASFINHSQKAWKTQGSEFKQIFKVLGNEVYKSEQAKTNFLITDLPEFFTDIDMLYGRRFGVNCRDLKVDKIGIPKFKKIDIPEEIPAGNINKIVEQEIIKYNSEVDQKNLRLEEIMKTYPFEYGILDAATDDDFYREGYQYVLLNLNTAGISIRELLDFKMDYTETDYITLKSTEYGTTLTSLPVNTKVNKYYVRHLYTKDVYAGAKWDAGESWEDALKNFIKNMKDEFKID